MARIHSLWLACATALLTWIVPTAALAGGPIVVDELRLLHETHLVTYTDGYVALVDVAYPDPATSAPTANGWPMAVLVHGAGQRRTDMALQAETMARRGIFTLTYDVRGQGESMGLNDPLVYGWTMVGPREIHDLAEVIECVGSLHPSLVDLDRIGITGISQGAMHCWAAAAFSGRPLPPNPWRTAPFPAITAVAPRGFVEQFLPAALPEEGRTVHHRFLRMLFPPGPNLHFEPALYAQLTDGVLNGRTRELWNDLYDPAFDIGELLLTSQVPIYAWLSYDDFWAAPSSVTQFWESLPAGVPRRLDLRTGTHGAPGNRSQANAYGANALVFFDEFLRGTAGDPLTGVYAAITPDDPGRYTDPESIWDGRTSNALTPDGLTTLRLHLLEGGRLRANAPSLDGAPDHLTHRIPVGLTAGTYAETQPTPDLLMTGLPLQSILYDTLPLPRDLHLFGETRLALRIDSPDGSFQIHAAILDVGPDGTTERFVTSGHVTRVNEPVSGPQTIDISTAFQSYVFRTGHKIRLRIENLVWFRPPTIQESVIRVTPLLTDFDVDIVHTANIPSALDLPLLPISGPTVAPPGEVILGTPGDLPVCIFSDTSFEGYRYRILLGISGTTPGTRVRGVDIPLNFDAVTSAALSRSPAGPYAGFYGVIGPGGSAEGILDASFFATGPGACASRLDFVAVVSRGQGNIHVSQPATVRILR
jgi:predicted acyl esterase